MSVLFNRIYAYMKDKKVPLLNIQQRQELGKIVAAAYITSGIKKPLKRIKFEERESGNRNSKRTMYKVLYYPPEFTPQIDAIIGKFYEENPPAPKKLRPRIPAKPRKVLPPLSKSFSNR